MTVAAAAAPAAHHPYCETASTTRVLPEVQTQTPHRGGQKDPPRILRGSPQKTSRDFPHSPNFDGGAGPGRRQRSAGPGRRGTTDCAKGAATPRRGVGEGGWS